MDLVRKYHFYAAHRNKAADEKCARIHGHTYQAEVTLRFDELDNGLTMLFSEADNLMAPVFKQMDHYFLLSKDDTLCPLLQKAGEPFVMLPFETTLENLAQFFLTELTKKGLPVHKVKLSETLSGYVECYA